MKLQLILLVAMVTIVMAKEDRRFIIDTLASIFDIPQMKEDLQLIADAIGVDPTEEACELECHKLLSEGTVLQYGCPFLCHYFENLVHYYDITTPTV